MAKIDTSKISGYADMTAEQKLAALEAYEFEGVSKETFDKTAGEAAENKRKLREALNQANTDKTASDEALKALQGKVAEMEKREKVADYAASLMDQGYSKELAKEVATAMAEGDMATVFAKQQTFLAEREKQMAEAEINAQYSGSGEVDITDDGGKIEADDSTTTGGKSADMVNAKNRQVKSYIRNGKRVRAYQR